MKAVILAAGKGKRLRPRTFFTPKPLIKIKGKPIIVRTLESLPQKIEEVIVVVGHLGGKIQKFLGKDFAGKKITYVYQKEKKGTAHALWLCKQLLKKDRFFVLNGDDLYHKKDLEKCLKHKLCLLAQKAEHPERYGVIELNSNGTLKAIKEKPQNPQSNLINIGVYLLDGRIFNYKMAPIDGEEFGLPQTIAELAKDYPVKVEIASFWHPVNLRQELKKARQKAILLD